MDMEQHLPEAVQVKKSIIKKDASTKFYTEREQLYFETYTSVVGLEAGHL